MILRSIAQFILGITVSTILPMDGAYLEWQAGVETLPNAQYVSESQVQRIVSLPQSESLPETYPVKNDQHSYGIVTTATSAMVVDDASGMILFAKRPDELRSIGSVTKLASALVFLDTQPNLSQTVTLDIERDYVGGGRVYLAYYDGVALRDVLAASLVGSDNTATESLIHFSGLEREEFIARMNTLADEIGMSATQFVEPTGIDPRNRSTARDLIKLLAYAQNEDMVRFYTSLSQVTITQASGRQVTIENTNTLAGEFIAGRGYEVISGKTGYLPEAGYVLGTTVENEGDRVHVIVMGADSKQDRVDEVKGLAYWAFKTFDWP